MERLKWERERKDKDHNYKGTEIQRGRTEMGDRKISRRQVGGEDPSKK